MNPWAASRAEVSTSTERRGRKATIAAMLASLRRMTSTALAVPLSLLFAGAAVYGLIAAQSLVICADHGCEAAWGPSLTISLVALAVVITAIAFSLGRTDPGIDAPSQLPKRALVVVCVALGAMALLLMILWAGLFFGQAFGGFANPWHGVRLFDPAANFLIYGGSTSSAKVYWLGWPVGAYIELTLDIVGSAALLVGAALSALRLSRKSQSKRNSGLKSYVLVVAGIAIVLDLLVTVPAEAHDAAGFRAAHYLLTLRAQLVSAMNGTLQAADTQDAANSGQRASDLGQGDAKALTRFSDRLETISFPGWASRQLDAEKAALVNEIVAADDLANAAGQSPVAVQNAYARLDDALQRENLANRDLYYVLFPATYLREFVLKS